MSLSKRLYFPELYQEIDGIQANPQPMTEWTDEYNGVDPRSEQEKLMEQAEIYRDQQREDGINV